jgi:hypothetical protein
VPGIRSFGSDHPEVATDVNNLGSVLQDLGDLDGARKAFERALKIDEGAYGLDNNDLAFFFGQSFFTSDSGSEDFQRLVQRLRFSFSISSLTNSSTVMPLGAKMTPPCCPLSGTLKRPALSNALISRTTACTLLS